MRRVAIVASCLVAAAGIKVDLQDAAPPPALGMHKVTGRANLTGLSPRARAKFTAYNTVSTEASIESRTKQFAQRWIQTALKHIGKGLPPAMATMLPGMIMPMVMNYRASLPVEGKIVFDGIMAMKQPIVHAKGTPVEDVMKDLVYYLKALGSIWEDAGRAELAKNFLVAYNTTTLFLETPLRSKLSGYINKSSPNFLKVAMLEDVAAILDERGWLMAADKMHSKGIPTARLGAELKQKIAAIGPVKDIDAVIPHIPEIMESVGKVLALAGHPDEAYINQTTQKIVDDLTLVSNVQKVSLNTKGIHDAQTLAAEFDKIASAFEKSGHRYEKLAGVFRGVGPAILELGVVVEDLKNLTIGTTPATQALSFRRIAAKGEKWGMPAAVPSFWRDVAAMVETNTADIAHLEPRIAQFVNEEKLLKNMSQSTLAGYAGEIDVFAKMICDLDGLKDKVSICISK